MNPLTDEFIQKVFLYLEELPYDRIIKVDDICIEENKGKFVDAVKLYIDSWPYGGGVAFITNDLDRFRKVEIPEAALKELHKH